MNFLLLPFTLSTSLLVVYGSLTRAPHQRFAPFPLYESPEYKAKMLAYHISDAGGIEASARAYFLLAIKIAENELISAHLKEVDIDFYGKEMIKLDDMKHREQADADAEVAELNEKKRQYEASLAKFHHMKEDIAHYIKLIKSNIENAAEVDGQRFVWLLSNSWQHYVMERGPPPEDSTFKGKNIYFYYEGILYGFPVTMTKAEDLRIYFESVLGWESRKRIMEWSRLDEEFRKEYELQKSRSLSCQDNEKDEREKAIIGGLCHYAASRYTMNRERLETEARLLEERLKNDLPMLVEIAHSLIPVNLPNAFQLPGKFALNGKYFVLAVLFIAILWEWLLSYIHV